MKATQRKQQAILDAALVLFSERGVAGTGIEAIAELAQVSRQSVYTYYTSKEGILQALLEQFFQTGTQAWLTDQAQAGSIHSQEQLEQEVFNLMRVAVATLMNPEYLKVMRIVVAESSGNPSLGEKFREALALPMMTAMRSILIRSKRPLSSDDTDVAMRFAIGPLLPYVLLDGLLQAGAPQHPDESRLRLLARLVATAYWHFEP